jgi:hypothetical protein
LLHSGVAAWGVALLLAATRAEAEPAAAVKFALRGVAACAAFFAAVDLAAEASYRARLSAALACGGALAAAATLAELADGQARWLLAFKPAVFRAEDVLRASGPFPYPNVAALYLEAILPLALAWSARPVSRSGRWLRLAAPLALVAAIVATGSRAGLAVALAALMLVFVMDRKGRLGLRGPATLCAATLVAVLTALVLSHPGMAGRLRLEGDGAWYRADYAPAVSSLALRPGEQAIVELRLHNRGAIAWSASGRAAVLVSAEWHDAAGRVVAEGEQVPIPQDVPRGASISIAVPVHAPAVAGSYALRWRLGAPGLTWAEPAGAAGEVSVVVALPGASPASSEEARPGSPAQRPIQRQLTRFELWRAALSLWREHPLTGVGPDNFRRLYAGVLGSRPIDERIRANNLYLGTLVELGLLGFATLAVVISLLARRALPALRATGVAERLAAVGPAVGLGALLLHGLVDDVFHANATAILFWVLAGLVAAVGRPAR